jgi:EAL domain-containing protein (putative c-di-GMP-specific phosphodiesterase class I)
MMHVRTLAEGIETQEQYDALAELGCNFGQGYLFSHPLPSADVAAWAAQQVPHYSRPPSGRRAAQPV